jgi:hypothetical protein
MKKLILILSVICFGVYGFQGATAKGGNNTTSKTNFTAYTYRCPVCGATSTKPGDCAKDKVTMVKVGDYYCPDCYMSSSKPGKCEMCGVAMKQMQATAVPTVKQATAPSTK